MLYLNMCLSNVKSLWSHVCNEPLEAGLIGNCSIQKLSNQIYVECLLSKTSDWVLGSFLYNQQDWLSKPP